ncbi:hypothetical protein D3C73_1439900 [compost metagenome]
MKVHETQKDREHISGTTASVLPNLEAAQRIEGGSPPQKIVFSQLPKPIRFIGYGIYGVCFLMLAAVVLVYVVK